MIYEWFMVICLYAYVASSLSKALPLWRLRRRAKISGTRSERDEATFAAYAATWSALAIAFAAFAAIVITSPDNQFVDVVRVEGALAPEACARVAAACVETNQCVGPTRRTRRKILISAQVAEPAPRPTSRLAEFAAVPSR